MIKVQNLVKWFGPKLAVDDVSFAVDRGEVLGFLGPNGAGKSTTMRMITGFLPPSAGEVEIGGFNMQTQGLKARAMIGYLPENAPAYPEMSVSAFLRFIAELRGKRGKDRDLAVERAIDLCFLDKVRNQTIETLSKGYRHRTCFAQSLLHDPDILVLDEPTDGLDPNQKHEVRNLIKNMGRQKAIILSTHILEEVDAVCSRVIIIDQGRLVFNGPPGELRAKSRLEGAVTLCLAAADRTLVKDTLQAMPEVREAELLSSPTSGKQVRIRLFPQDRQAGAGALAAAAAAMAQKSNWTIAELHTERGRLDEVFRDITVSETRREVLK